MNGSSGVGMLKLTVNGGHVEEYLWQVAESVQQLPGVLRVRVECSRDEMEIIFRCPSEGLLQSVHQALREAGREVMPAT